MKKVSKILSVMLMVSLMFGLLHSGYRRQLSRYFGCIKW